MTHWWVKLYSKNCVVKQIQSQKFIFWYSFISQKENVFDSLPVCYVLLYCGNFFSQLWNKIFWWISKVKVIFDSSFFQSPIIYLNFLDLSHVDLCLYQGLIKIFSHDIKWLYSVWLWGLLVQGKNWTNIDCLIVIVMDCWLDWFCIKIRELIIRMTWIIIHGLASWRWFCFLEKLRFRSWTAKSKGWNLGKILNTISRLKVWEYCAHKRLYWSSFMINCKWLAFVLL